MLLKHLGVVLTLLSLVLFVPGIVEPMFSLNMEMKAQLSNAVLNNSLIDKELSILATIDELWRDNRLLVASLIFIFSVVIPIIKTCLVAFAYWKRNTAIESKIMQFIASIGKWSMADVFVVAIFLAILSTKHAATETVKQFTVFGFKLDLLVSTETLSNAGQGFYYFTGYCLLSLLGTQLYMHSVSSKK